MTIPIENANPAASYEQNESSNVLFWLILRCR